LYSGRILDCQFEQAALSGVIPAAALGELVSTSGTR
jgi:hypothetical protein